ncbi:GTPase-activating protein skywalker isoform X2 [Patella vulgata]|uniref:GTPase-activating protein skywalker isoform X2 n=1 Tax=Patella vulgata TaxID=6465 RepID=UPI00217F6571|nr:GTPase-activating protein skywalker isoform X2 [Patella vulgata]
MQGTVTDTQTPSTQQNRTTLLHTTEYDTCAPDLESDQNGHETALESSFPDSHSVFSEFVSLEVLKRDTTVSSDSSVSSDFFDDSVDHLILVLKHDNIKNMKQFLRTRFWMVDHEIRESLWLNLCRHLHKADGDIYEEMVTELFPDENIKDVALPGFIDQNNLTPYFLTNDGVHQAAKILAVIINMNPDITYCPPVFSLSCLFLHYMNSNECFNCLYGLLRSKDINYLMQTRVAWDASKYVMKDLTKKYAKSAYVHMIRQCSNIESIFERWIWWIFSDLPFEYIVKIIDCFLLEGVKVLYRVGLAILITFAKHNGRRNSREVVGSNLGVTIKLFCDKMPININKLLKVAFGIRGLTRKEIKKLQVKNEMYVNSKSHIANHEISRVGSNHSVHGVPLSRSFSGPIILQHVGTSILNVEMIHLIWGWLPPRLAVCQPFLLYTSEEHGTSLRTLYSKIEDKTQTIIIIKTTRGEIFGAFCSAPWEERKSSNKNLSYFGTGETFLFSLQPCKRKYDWVGIIQEGIPKTANMFLAGDNSVMTIGGGNGEAIQLDENLVHCRSEKCDTFQNEPLCSYKDFTCQVVEVYGFE